MPNQYHNVEVDNIWKIKRKVAKIMRANNDDDRGLVETKDMSEETEKLTTQLSGLSNLLYDMLLLFQQQKGFDVPIPRKIAIIQDKIDSILRIVKNTDFNKMDTESIQKVKIAIGKLQEQDSLYNKYNTSLLESYNALFKYNEAEDPDNRGEVALEEDFDAEREGDNAFLEIKLRPWDDAFKGVSDIIEIINLKMSSYKETSAVLDGESWQGPIPKPRNVDLGYNKYKEEEGEEGGRMIGGCDCTQMKYLPMFQTPKYY
tara:strand:+ start:6139 stop:6915 length:777 start_codon:yes stop_codon:yes gene_type:complete